jgi:hypothetical protein
VIPVFVKRNSIIGMIGGILAIVVLWLYGRPLGMMLSTKWDARTQPELWVVPQPLPATAAETSIGKSFSYLGYEFESPWTDVAFERKTNSVVVLNFSNGQGIAVFDWPQGPLQMLKGETAEQAAALQAVLGAEATRSNYAFLSSILAVTPGDLRVFSSRHKMVANSVLLSMKQIEISKVKGRVYSFETDAIRGFQKGDPLQDVTVTIEAFDAQDHKIELLIGAKPNTNPKPSQADINRILYSFRPASTALVK